MNNKTLQLFDLISKGKLKIHKRILIFGDNNYIVADKDGASALISAYDMKTIRRRDVADRGGTLEFFTKIDYVVDSILVNLLSPDEEDKILDILNSIDFYKKFCFLRDWGLIESSDLKQLYSLKELRNSFAHNWKEGSIKYKGVSYKKKSR